MTSPLPLARPWLGATWDGSSTTFLARSRDADGIEACLFAPDAPAREVARLPMSRREGDYWELRTDRAPPGTLYGFRAHGPWAPERGLRFDAAKLLVDPRARAIDGDLALHPSLSARPGEAAHGDTAPHVPKAVVVDHAFEWPHDPPPATPWERTVVYECHVRLATARHPAVPEHLRGKYLGLCAEPVLRHLTALGVTAVQIMPVAHAVSEVSLLRRGLRNAWGYSPVGFFAPSSRYATASRGEQVREFREMVRRFHAAGIEVLLDVVHGHSPEEDSAAGATFSLRGLDAAGVFRLDPADPARDVDVTGCGNTLDARLPHVQELVLDSMRFWASDMHVDGFRIDQATVLGRGDDGEFDRDAPLLKAILSDPVLSRMKLLAEPWDAAGYALGRFPRGFAEWNDRFRDGARTFWRGDAGRLGELARRVSGSRDVFGYARRPPRPGSVNYIAAHDGFTLADLVTYARPHDEANLGADATGHDQKSANWGVEGPVTEEASLSGPVARRVALRRRRVLRSFLATLAFSEGVPMIGQGDEMGRTQRGNGNAYCIDGPSTWLDWELDEARREQLRFARRAFALRRAHRVLRVRPADEHVRWWHPSGRPMDVDDWQDPEARAVGLGLHDEEDGTELLWLLNGHRHLVRFALPSPPPGRRWFELLHGTRDRVTTLDRSWSAVAASSFVLLSARG